MSTITPGSEAQYSQLTSLFSLEMGSIQVGDIQSVSGLNIDIEEVESKEIRPNGKMIGRFRPGTVKYGELTLKRVFTGDKTLYEWHKAMAEGKKEYQDGSVVLYNLDGTEAARWNLMKAWPSKWAVSDLDASTDDVVTEDITIQMEFIERAS